MAHDDFAFLGAETAPWAPWHGLVVERLFAWLATEWHVDVSPLDSAQAETWTQLNEADQQLHQFLQLYDLQYSFAGTWQDGPAATGNNFFYQRLVYGASANPVFQEINHVADRNGKVQTFRHSDAHVGYANDLAAFIEQRATGISPIDCSISLDKTIIGTRIYISVLCRYNSNSYSAP